MTFSAYVAMFFCVCCIGLILALCWALDRKDAAERQARCAEHMLDEARTDYAVSIRQAGRMARLIGED